LFNVILDQLLPIREQLEIMYVRCVLKPVICRMKKLNEKPADADGAEAEKKADSEHDEEIEEEG
jgi:hypothetical protein